jgi:hypothetical protein
MLLDRPSSTIENGSTSARHRVAGARVHTGLANRRR